MNERMNALLKNDMLLCVCIHDLETREIYLCVHNYAGYRSFLAQGNYASRPLISFVVDRLLKLPTKNAHAFWQHANLCKYLHLFGSQM
jgi:hypothetical protein